MEGVEQSLTELADGTPGDAFDGDPDELEQLGDEIAVLAAQLHAVEYRMLVLIAEFDRLRGWERGGHRSCAYWLSLRTGIDLGAARQRVRTAHALVGLPELGEAMAQGQLSFSKVRAVTRVATPESEGAWLELARGATTAQLERMVRASRRGSRKDEAAWVQEQLESRAFSIVPDDDGMYVVRGRLMPEVGALLMRALDAAGDALFREKRVPGARSDSEREAAQRRADAVELLAERALAAGFGARPGCGATGPGCGEACTDSEAPLSGTRAERYQVVLHLEPATLRLADEPGRSELEDGTRVSAEPSRRLCCDGAVVRVAHARDGSILDVQRKTRTIHPPLRRALEARDRGCRFPGCGLRFTDAHHVIHWADGGETSLENCLLLCGHHHRLVHEGGWTVQWWGAGRPVFYSPTGGMHFDGGWEPPRLPEQPVQVVIAENLRRGVAPDADTAGARWKREADIPPDVYFRALDTR